MSRDIDELRERAVQGDPEAQFRLGTMHLEGTDVAEDYPEAVDWIRKAACARVR